MPSRQVQGRFGFPQRAPLVSPMRECVERVRQENPDADQQEQGNDGFGHCVPPSFGMALRKLESECS
jgi:hypothetical protein